jgi:regulator of cell morphogenesis and NO signaling
MKHATLDVTVGQLVAERPERARLFEKYGIDYCCGGSRPLGAACEAHQLDPREVLHSLVHLETGERSASESDWLAAPIPGLIDHITDRHHAYLRDALPRISYLINKVWDAHSLTHHRLSDVAAVFSALRNELELHMAKEEQVLFPLCRSIADPDSRKEFQGLSLRNVVAVMEEEHLDAGNALKQLRELTDDYTPPIDACPTYRVMLSSLAELEADMHQHVHKENNILFPRAIALDEEQAARQ